MKYVCDGPEEYVGFNGVDLSRTDFFYCEVMKNVGQHTFAMRI